MNDTEIERAETLLSYYGHHAESMTYGSEAAHREWWMREAATALRALLPEWSAFKDEPARELPRLAALLAEPAPWDKS